MLSLHDIFHNFLINFVIVILLSVFDKMYELHSFQVVMTFLLVGLDTFMYLNSVSLSIGLSCI